METDGTRQPGAQERAEDEARLGTVAILSADEEALARIGSRRVEASAHRWFQAIFVAGQRVCGRRQGTLGEDEANFRPRKALRSALGKGSTLHERGDQVNLTHRKLGSTGALEQEEYQGGPNVKHGRWERPLL